MGGGGEAKTCASGKFQGLPGAFELITYWIFIHFPLGWTRRKLLPDGVRVDAEERAMCSLEPVADVDTIEKLHTVT